MLAQYHKYLRQWEEETERQKYEFTITEKDLIQSNQLNKYTQVRNHIFNAYKYHLLNPNINILSNKLTSSGRCGV